MTLPRQEEPGTAAAAGPVLEPRRTVIKAVVLLGVVGLGMLAYRFTPLKAWLQPAGEAAAWMRTTGGWGAAAFFALSAVLIFLGVPRLVFCPIAGAVYGFWGGLALSLVSPATAYFTTFLYLRGRQLDGAATPLPRALAFLGHDPGFAGVILARMIPLPGMVITLALSLSRVRRRSYFFGTLIGMAPEAIPLVLLGSGWLNADRQSLPHFGLIALLLAGVFWLAFRFFRHRQKRIAPGPPGSGPAAR